MTVLLAAVLVVAALSVETRDRSVNEKRCANEAKVEECTRVCGPLQRDGQGALKYKDVTDERGIDLMKGLMMLNMYEKTWRQINCSSFEGTEFESYETSRSKELMDKLRNNEPQLVPCPKDLPTGASGKSDWCSCPKTLGYECYDYIECIMRKHSAINEMINWTCDDSVCDPAKYACPADDLLPRKVGIAIKHLVDKKEDDADSWTPEDADFLSLLNGVVVRDESICEPNVTDVTRETCADRIATTDTKAACGGSDVGTPKCLFSLGTQNILGLKYSEISRTFAELTSAQLDMVKDSSIKKALSEQKTAAAKFHTDCLAKKESETANQPVLCTAVAPPSTSGGAPRLSTATAIYILAFVIGINALLPVW